MTSTWVKPPTSADQKRTPSCPLKTAFIKRLIGGLEKSHLGWQGVLIKAVATIPTYAMSMFELSGDLTHDIQSAIFNYW